MTLHAPELLTRETKEEPLGVVGIRKSIGSKISHSIYRTPIEDASRCGTVAVITKRQLGAYSIEYFVKNCIGAINVVRIESKRQLRRFIAQLDAGTLNGPIHLVVDAAAYSDDDNRQLAEACTKNERSSVTFFGGRPSLPMRPPKGVKIIADLSFCSTRNKWERALRAAIGTSNAMGVNDVNDESRLGRQETDREREKRRKQIQSDLQLLTPRQSEVLALILEGLTNKQIGLRMGIAESTVKAYVGDLMAKFRVFRRTQLMALHSEVMALSSEGAKSI